MVFPIGPVRARQPDTLIGFLKGRKLTGNLRLCLDAGDADSYPGTGQKWLDTSGNGHDFFFGNSAAVQGFDPTFNGVAGGKSASEYMSTDGGDYFQYDSANESWMNNLSLNNAKFSVGLVYYQPAAVTVLGSLFGTGGASSSNAGGELHILSGNRFRWFGRRSNTSQSFSFPTTGTFSLSAWHFVGLTIDEAAGAGGGFFYLDGDYLQVGSSDTFNAAYSSPSGSGYRLALMGGPGSTELRSGSRLAMVFCVEGAVLSKADFDNIYADIKAARSGFNLP